MKKVGLVTLLIVILAVLGWGFWQYQRYTAGAGTREINSLMKKVSDLMVLPDEVPTIATVTDKSKLEDQVFFKNAINGDKVIIFSVAGKAVLYRPSIDKIIEIASVQAVAESKNQIIPEPTGIPGETDKLTVVLYNGTTTAGLTNKIEKELVAKFSDIRVVAKESAARSDYQKTVIIDIGGQNPDLLNQLAEYFEAKIVAMPEGEAKPAAEVLIILGKGSN